MERKIKIIKNFTISFILLISFMYITNLHFTPLSAYRDAERSSNYGPSDIKYIEDFDGGKYIIGKYDKWISYKTINRFLFFFWYSGDGGIIKYNPEKVVDLSGSLSLDRLLLYGIINDESVKRVEIILENGKIINCSDFHNQFFIITMEFPNKEGSFDFKVKAYNEENNLIYEDER